MKKTKAISKKKVAAKTTKKTKSPATKKLPNTTLKNDPDQDFGGLKIKRKSSSDEGRKNVNGDPNLIQVNELE